MYDSGSNIELIKMARKFNEYVETLRSQNLPLTDEKYVKVIALLKPVYIELYKTKQRKLLKRYFSPQTRKKIIEPFLKTYIEIGLVLRDAGLLQE